MARSASVPILTADQDSPLLTDLSAGRHMRVHVKGIHRVRVKLERHVSHLSLLHIPRTRLVGRAVIEFITRYDAASVPPLHASSWSDLWIAVGWWKVGQSRDLTTGAMQTRDRVVK